MEQGNPQTKSWRSLPTCMLSFLRRLLRQHKQCEPCLLPIGRIGLQQGRQAEGRTCRGGPAAPRPGFSKFPADELVTGGGELP